MNATSINNSSILSAILMLEASGITTTDTTQAKHEGRYSFSATKGDKTILVNHSGITFINKGEKTHSFWANKRINAMVVASDINLNTILGFFA